LTPTDNKKKDDDDTLQFELEGGLHNNNNKATKELMSELTEADVGALTVAKLKEQLDKRGVSYEKKDLKATLAAKLRDVLSSSSGSKKKDDDDDRKDDDDQQQQEVPPPPGAAKKRKAEEETEEEEEEEKKTTKEESTKKKVVIAKKKKAKTKDEEEEEKKEFSDDDDDDDDEKDYEKDEKLSKESLIPDATNPENCTMTVYIKGNEGRLIGKKGETLKYIEGRFRASIKLDRDNGTCAVKGPTAEMEECKKIIQEVCETGSIADRPISQQGPVLKEHETLNGISAANVNAFSIDEESLPEELRGMPNDQEVAIEIPCPGQEGRVIGRGGATIRDIERVSGANLKVVKGSGICNVQGKRIDVIRARQVVLETMALEKDTFGMQQQQQQYQQQQMMTPSQYAAMQMGGGGGGVYGGYQGASVYGQQQQTGSGMGSGGNNINPIVPEGQTRIVIPTQGHEGRIIGKGGAHVKLLRDRTGCDVQMDRSKQPVTCVITGTAANVKECERLVNEAIEKANQTFGPNGSKMYTAQQQQQQQQYNMVYGQQATAAPVNVYGAAPQQQQVYGAAAATTAIPQVYGAAVPQQQQQQQQLMQQYQQYYQQQQVYAAPQQQEYDPSQPQSAATAAAAASDWATYYSDGKPYYHNSKTGETKWA
jgi:far upstream element-binding protein